MTLAEYEDIFKRISIRGRFAFGVKSLEQYVAENFIENDWIYELLETLREFTLSTNLNEWDNKIGVFEYQLPSQSLEPNFKSMIQYVIEIGTQGLYGGTGEYSPSTLNPTLKLVEIIITELNKVPRLKKFEFSKFSEHHGWGESFNMNRLE